MSEEKEQISCPSYEGDDDQETNFYVTEYDITAAPNDFNITTLNSFISSGIVKIPGFQRNYVWDIKHASKLIESILIGIPIPQIFLFEESRNKFMVIDGQQRYMTIYYFKSKRFPRIEKRYELRRIFDNEGQIPNKILSDNEYFTDFNLSLPELIPGKKNKFNNLNYNTLEDDDKTTFDLRTIRNIIIKQNSPEDDNSVIFEIFNRLNTGGVNLKQQEIRTSLFHSDFYDMLYKINLDDNWRQLTPSPHPDINMKDVEIILRGFAQLFDNKTYKPSMTKFLNNFSVKAKKFTKPQIDFCENLFKAFTQSCIKLNPKLFYSKTGRFNISVYEAIFVACCEQSLADNTIKIKSLIENDVESLKANSDFINATQTSTAHSSNVETRIRLAKSIL